MATSRTARRFTAATVAFGGLLGAFLAGNWVAAQAPPVPAAPAPYKPEEPANRGLDANLFMQTSAEYRACCHQAYNLASLRLNEALTNKPAGKLAVVLDLDETVFDNAGFQAMQLRSNLAYDQRLWDVWEQENAAQVALIPGAKEFILEAVRLGVTVAYISNRNEKSRTQTKSALDRLGIGVAADGLLKLACDTSDKTKRRQEVEHDYTVILNIGDNLRDFDETLSCRKLDKKTPDELQQAIQDRKDLADKHGDDWGKKWIILPNPAYGEWMKPLGRGRSDLDRLAPPLATK